MGAFHLTMDTNNAAFDDGDGVEVARILRLAAEKVESGVQYGSLRDINGNVVGRFETVQD